jgi:DNA-binding response OmpR family regulator
MSNIRKILICDDDGELRGVLVDQLQLYDEFRLEDVATATAAVQKIKADSFDLVIMDVGLPDMDGREAVKLMRKSGLKCPVIMLTAQDGDADTILGLEAGANDYVSKPFRFSVLLARIRAHLRQHESSDDAIFRVGPYNFHPGSKLLVTEKGAKTRLTEKETAILRFLYRAGQRVVSRDVLLREVWGYNSSVTTHTLETHVYRLRQKIEVDPGRAKLLLTENGGYKLVP